MTSPDTHAEIRRHFRKETSKLDNWIYHRRIDEYFKDQGEGEDAPES